MNIRIFASGSLASPAPHGREMPITATRILPWSKPGPKNLFGAMAPDEGSRAQASARFGLAHPGISGVVLGLAELSHLEEALAAAAMGPLPEDGIAGL